jgi:glycosyltransferase involved in cell wall biosynthesis
MRIVYLSSSAIPSRTANSIHVMKMCRALSLIGNEVILITPENLKVEEKGIGNPFLYYGIEKCFLLIKMKLPKVKGGGHIHGFFAARRAKQYKPDLVIGRNIKSVFFASLLRLPVVLEVHQPIFDSGKLSEWLFRRILRKKNFLKLVVITHNLKKYFKGHYSNLKCKILVLPDGADPVKEFVSPINLKTNGNRLHVGYIGHLYQGRGIEVIEKLAERTKNWADFHIVGGNDADIDRCKKRNAHLDNFLIYGFKTPPEAEKIRISCDVLIAPYQENVLTAGGNNTLNWMSPLKVFEYMASGRAIMCSNIPVIREVLKDGENALLITPDSIDDWVGGLEKLKELPKLKASLEVKAKKDFVELYTWEARAKLLLSSLMAKKM